MTAAFDKRITDHPILGPLDTTEQCTIFVDSKPLIARLGEPILAALMANDIWITRFTKKLGSPRGLFCGIGLCNDCLVFVDGLGCVRSCVTAVEEDMSIETRTNEKRRF